MSDAEYWYRNLPHRNTISFNDGTLPPASRPVITYSSSAYDDAINRLLDDLYQKHRLNQYPKCIQYPEGI